MSAPSSGPVPSGAASSADAVSRHRTAPSRGAVRRFAAALRFHTTLCWQVPLALVLMIVAIAGAGVRFELVGLLYLAAATPELCRIDVAEHRLPNALVLPGLAFAGVGVVFGWLAGGGATGGAVLAALAVGGFFALLAAAGGMGMGDVKLAAVLALAGGAVSALVVAGTVVLGFVLAGGTALARIASRGAAGDLAFGPYLLGAFWASLALTPLV